MPRSFRSEGLDIKTIITNKREPIPITKFHIDRNPAKDYNLLAMNAQPKPHVLFTKEEIEATVKKLASEIKRDYHDKNPLLIGILKGSFVFMADLIRQLGFPLEVEFVRISSYGRSTESCGRIKMVQGAKTKVKDRHVLVIEDIVDTGLTTAFLVDCLVQKKPASLKICALTSKPARRKVPINIDYLGFTVPNKFIVGYGIDWDEKFRYLPDICYVEVEE